MCLSKPSSERRSEFVGGARFEQPVSQSFCVGGVLAAEPDGFAKLLYRKKHRELLGAHIIGDNATELIAEMGLALDQELTIDDIHATIHAHPTMSEVIHEATLAAEGHAIHF